MRGLGISGDSAGLIGTTNTISVEVIPYTQQKNRTGDASTETATAIDMTGPEVLQVNWDKKQQAIYQILGFSWRDVVTGSLGGGGSRPFIRRYLPEYRPDWQVSDFGGGDQRPFLTAVRVQSHGISPGKAGAGYHAWSVGALPDERGSGSGVTKDAAEYKFADLAVQYDYLPYDLYGDSSVTEIAFADGTGSSSFSTTGGGSSPAVFSGAALSGFSDFISGTKMGRFISFQRKPAAEYLSIPAAVGSKEAGAGFLRWSDNGLTSRLLTVIPGNVGFIVGNIDFKFTWHQVPWDALPNNTINGLIGRVNMRPIGLPGGQTTTALPGQLLLIAVDTPLTGSPYGNRLWNVEYTMRYNPRGHNNFYDFVSGGWYQATKDGRFYGYKDGGGYFFAPTASVTNYGDPPDGVMLYDSRDFNRLFCPE